MRVLSILAVIGAALVLAACGDDEETPAPQPAATPTLTQPPVGAPADPLPATPAPVTPGTPANPALLVPELPPEPVNAPPPQPAAEVVPGAAAPAANADMPANADIVARIAAADPIAGADAARQCRDCHTVEEGGRTIIGPNLFGVVGRLVGSQEGFAYSPALMALNAAGATWTYERLDAFLTSPATAVPGTRMGFGGISNPDTRTNVIAWLRLQAATPEPLP